MSSPLKGIRVLELGQFIAGPYAGLQLADLGAQVIKVERPQGGDAFREFGLSANAQGYSHNFCAFNRNKLSLTLDINSPRGQKTFLRMARQADVVLENFRPGVMKRLRCVRRVWLQHDSVRANCNMKVSALWDLSHGPVARSPAGYALRLGHRHRECRGARQQLRLDAAQSGVRGIGGERRRQVIPRLAVESAPDQGVE